METALTYTLQRVQWQFFGSMTFKITRLSERVRVTMFFALVRCLCRWHKVPFRKCVWALRQEVGEISGRLHFHFLIAGSPHFWECLAASKSCFLIKARSVETSKCFNHNSNSASPRALSSPKMSGKSRRGAADFGILPCRLPVGSSEVIASSCRANSRLRAASCDTNFASP
jgi:hypothetical protein